MAAYKEKNKKVFLEALEAKAGNISQACKASGISRQTFYRWMMEDPQFNVDYLNVRESLIDFAEATLLSLIKDRQPTATIYFLKTQAKHRGYSE